MRTKDQLAFIKPISHFEYRSMSDNGKNGLVAVIEYQRNRVTDDWHPDILFAFVEHYTDDEKIAIWEKCIAAIQAEIKKIPGGDFS